jgi:catechol 2,3-dioxygenase-like lactoylglutathione lyase family enzyme
VLDHIVFGVSNFARSRQFYEAALAPLGYGVTMQIPSDGPPKRTYVGFGESGLAYFWIGDGAPLQGQIHVAFVAKDRLGVDAFYRAAMAAGATDNGAPGLRADYHANYYAAFVLDPDGHNIEAVCHRPP